MECCGIKSVVSLKGSIFLCFFLWNVLLFKQYSLYVTAIPSQAFTPMHEVSFLLVIQKVFLFFVHHMSSTMRNPMGCFIVFVYSSHDPPEQWDSSHWALGRGDPRDKHCAQF